MANDKSGRQISKEEKILINFRDTELMAVLEYYAKLIGKTFVPEENIKGRVTVLSPEPVSRANAIKLLFSILDMRGYAVVEVDGFYKVIKKQVAMKSSVAAFSPKEAGDRLVTEVIQPRHVKARAMVDSFRRLISSEGSVTADESANFLVITDSAANVKKLKSLIYRIDKPGDEPVTQNYRLHYLTVKEVAPTLEKLLADSNVQQNQKAPKVLFDERTNTVIISAVPALQTQAEKTLNALDVRTLQVLLEARIVEVTLDESSRMGLNWAALIKGDDFNTTLSLVESGGNSTTASTGINASIVQAGAYSVILNMLESDTRARVLSSPHLVTSNNQEASLSVGEEIPMLKEFRLDANNNPIETYERQKVGLDLTIRPTIADNHDVTLNLNMKLSSVLQEIDAGRSFSTSQREVKTTVVVKDAQTLIISGLIRDDFSRGSIGAPFLKDIPILGKALGAQSDVGAKRELLLLITPTVIRTEADVNAASDRESRKHPEAVKAGAVHAEPGEFEL
ncbi:putative type II and III secretion system protein [Magnetofaba australis IT-1]|uniref:Putative type II and III secretion system protein n=2 Tax=Magnetofaba TaxID=1472292 RepID=A0A1Y2K9B6_9PROT|nr:putative type II and III secretion system protein [Magnetofaba australis IT-1]